MANQEQEQDGESRRTREGWRVRNESRMENHGGREKDGEAGTRAGWGITADERRMANQEQEQLVRRGKRQSKLKAQAREEGIRKEKC
eukprot:2114284-Pleurochrysis_carterae.AAC.3